MQDFSSLIFGKPLKEISLEDIEAFFSSPQAETDKLEFKAYMPEQRAGAAAEFEKKILRSIAAFLNSEGGILVLGSPKAEGKVDGDKENFQGALVATDVRHEKDAFMAKVANRIVPSPRGILFHRLSADPDRYVYLLEVPPSEYAPHQFDHIYYMRLDGQTIPAPHHYIEALFRKVTFPKLEAYLKIYGWTIDDNHKLIRVQCAIIFRNQSAYQNDYDLHCRLISTIGLITAEGKAFNLLDTRIKEGTDFVEKKVVDTIYFRNYVVHPFDLVMDQNSLKEEGYQLNLVIVFGARKSPMRQCRYRLQVGPVFPVKKQDLIVQKDENRYFHEFGEDDLSDQVQLDNLLNGE